MHRLLASFGFALTGLRYAFRTQANFRIHVAISIAVTAIGLGVQPGPIEWAVLIVTMMIVLTTELMNTALEATLDRVGVELHPLAKVAKDVAAGAVLVSVGGAVLVGLLILGPHLWRSIGPR